MKTKTPEKPATMGIPGPGRHGGPAGHFARTVEKPKNTKNTLLKIWQYLKQEKTGLIFATLAVVAMTALNILGPYLMKDAIDLCTSGAIDLVAVARILVKMIIVYGFVVVLALVQRWIMISVSQKAMRNLRSDVFHQFQLLTVKFFDTRHSGELMSRVTNDIDNVSMTVSNSFLELLSAVLSIVAVTVVMILLNWQLALICLALIPLVILITKKIAKHTRKGFRDRQRLLGGLNGLIEESISGQRVVKAFTKEADLLRDFSEKNGKLQTASRRANIFAGFMGPIMNMMNNLNYAVTAFAGGLLAMYGIVSVGTIAAFLSYTRQFSRPLNQIAQLYNTIQSAIAGAERVFEILEETPEFEDTPDSVSMPAVRGDVNFTDLHFRYLPDIPIIKGIDIDVKAGQTIALVGPTGAGKTTIINLLTRFYDYHRGRITIDGTDIRTIKKADLRKLLGIVLQETFLFSDTVKENLRYGRLDASDEEIIEAAKLANAHQFIHRMSEGYDTEVSENGASLSEGQKQLIAIARAILSDPSILILDEATSSVDTRTEIHIQEGMLKLMEGRTSFVIAHRLSTIKNADMILVMNDGCIIERGTHTELLEAQGFYYNLYHSQFGISN